MVEATNNEEEDWGDQDDWDNYGADNDEVPDVMMAEVEKEVEQDKQIQENMEQLDAMRKIREELMSSRIAKLTNW